MKHRRIFPESSLEGPPLTDRPRLFGLADALTAVRVPLAIAFPLVVSIPGRLTVLAAAGLSDLLDGMVARKFATSRSGKILDPVADKLFMLVAFLTAGASGFLAWWEVALVLSRDIAAVLGLLYTVLRRRVTTIAARRKGKWVTVGQFLVLLGFVLESPLTRPLAWGTAALSAYAIWDYWRVGRAAFNRPRD